MGGFQAIKRQLLPLIKGLPIVVIVFLTALFIARKVIQYTPNKYQTIARVKLDNTKYGFSSSSLYSDFDLFSAEQRIQTEAMVLKSPLLVGMALDKLDLDVSIHRKGQVRNTMLYNDSPIVVEYDFQNVDLYDKDYFVKVLNDQEYIFCDGEGNTVGYEKQLFGNPQLFQGGQITVHKNHNLLNERSYDLAGQYVVHIFSRDGLIAYVSDRLDVVEVDKEISIIRVVYKDQHPEIVADIANAICETYIEDYIQSKNGAAQKTVDFIDQKLAQVHASLQQAEVELEQYKAINGIVNTRQETETGLRQISNLEISLINLEMNEKAILDLEDYISNGDYFNQTAVNFGFGDLLMTELVKKIKMWQDERHDLLIKYTPESDQVKAVDAKIEEIKTYIKEAIKRNKAEITTKREEIEKSVALASRQFDGLSTVEKEMRVLERNFHLQEQVYTFLSQKKIEAAIAASANLAFHRIIQPAVAPKKPISPNKTLITFVSGLFGLIIGVAFIYIRQLAMGRVMNRMDVEKNTNVQLAGVIRNKPEIDDFESIVKALRVRGKLNLGSAITVTSTVQGEGKTHLATHLVDAMMGLGLKVCYIDLNLFHHQDCFKSDKSLTDFLLNPTVENQFTPLHHYGTLPFDWAEKLTQIKSYFDFVIIDTPAAAMSMIGVEAMKTADLTLYLLMVNKTSLDYVSNAEKLMEEYGIENIELVLNKAHRATSFNGNFVGTRFTYSYQKLGLLNRFKSYLNTYVR